MFRIAVTAPLMMLSLLTLAPAVRSYSAPVGPVQLEARAGTRVEATLAAGERHQYTLTLAAGQRALVRLDQSSVDLTVDVSGTGVPPYKVSNQYDRARPEELLFASAVGLELLLSVASRGHGMAGTYAIEVVDLAPASAMDLERAAAEAQYWTLLHSASDQSAFQRMLKEVEAHVTTARAIVSLQRAAGDRRRELEATHLLSELLLVWGRRDHNDQIVLEALETVETGRAAAAAAQFELLEPHFQWLIAEASDTLGRTDAAERARADALSAARRLGVGTVAARVLNVFGTRYRDADPDRAIGYYTEAIEIWSANGDELRKAFGQHNMAGAYRSQGKVKEAVAATESAIASFRRLDQHYYAAAATVALAIGLSDLGRDEEAIARLREAIVFAKEKELGSGIAANQIALAHLLVKTGEHDEALAVIAEAEPLAKRVGGLDALMREKAVSDLTRGRIDEALPFFAREVEAAEKGLLQSVHAMQQSWKIANERSKYDIYVEALLKKSRATGDESLIRQAFEVTEKGRGRALLQQLAASGFNPTQHVPADIAARSRDLQARLAEAGRRRAAAAGDSEKIAVDRQIENLSREIAELDSRIAEANPAYGSLIRQPASLSLLQSLLDRDTMVLYYSLAYHESLDHSHLWVITRSEVEVLDVAGRTELAAAVAEYRSEIDRSSPTTRGLTPVSRSRSEARHVRLAEALAARLLHPAAEALARHKRLVIVPEGVVQYVPFAALPEKPGSAPLVDRREIVIVPSASVLGALRNRVVAREPAENGVRVFADPVFSGSDPRLSHVANLSANVASHADARRAAEILGVGGSGEIGRLPHTRREAEQIQSVAGSDAAVSLSFAASKQQALSPDVGSYRVVHFATHAFVDDKHPEVSGMLLSQFDPEGRAIDGFLRLNDIYGLRLNADLVVLSGCRTGLGKDVRGDGLVGFTRGFMYAGAPRVLVTLWSVHDEATAELMEHFYENMLSRKMPAAASLRQAQRQMRRSERWRDPFYWAGFVLQGDWK